MVLPFTASGQQKDNITYVPAQELLLVGKATTEGEYFHRVDTAKYRTMPPTVKKLFTNSAGLAISFTTNSPVIKAKWMVPDNYPVCHYRSCSFSNHILLCQRAYHASCRSENFRETGF